ncbi:hypothetical protein AAA799E16_01755 [Marine Group I thaumarchaeote SCGC AAA799-E16]|uniref:Uncharacterized protein n=2 Tax=Marine Group I TaxID=905826 RepID=A0A087RXJ5_9ARCH|nr:hypothetical protein AAA799E16_01755 [Marine Group I thaumarchaeote SCGC AAA799-E16]KFM18199.1 hypothetical protein SCCGRSA3_01269 [Marine Group I thaumarchaeote SCGC RSA3]
MDFGSILGIVVMVVGVIIGLIIYNAFSDALDCSTLTGYDATTPANSTEQAKACLETKSNANVVFGIIPVFIILGLIPLIRGALTRGL